MKSENRGVATVLDGLGRVFVAYILDVLFRLYEVCESGVDNVAARWVVVLVGSHDLGSLVEQSFSLVTQSEGSPVSSHSSMCIRGVVSRGFAFAER